MTPFKHVFRGLALALMIGSVALLGACEEEGSAEKAGKAVDEAAQSTEKQAEEAMESTKEALQEADKKIEEGAEATKEAMEEAEQKVKEATK